MIAEQVLAIVAECYRPGETLSGAFARLLSRLLPDLVVLDSSDPELKAAAAPVLAREIEEASPTSRLALEAGRDLLALARESGATVREAPQVESGRAFVFWTSMDGLDLMSDAV